MEAGSGLEPAPRRLRLPGLAGVLVLAVLVGIDVGALVSRLAGRSPAATAQSLPAGLRGEATWAAGSRPAPAITTLRDQTGARFTLGSLRGRTVVMEFFDSYCKAACPLAGRALAAAELALPAAQRPVLVVVSVNPRDTRASVGAAIRSWGLAGVAPWHWLMGSHAQLAPVWRAYHIFVAPTRGDITHTEALYLIDRRGGERSGYIYPYVPASVSHDLHLLAGPTGAGASRA